MISRRVTSRRRDSTAGGHQNPVLPSLPNLRFFLPAPVTDVLFVEFLPFQRINIFRSLLRVSRAASSDARAARALDARLHAPRTFTSRSWQVADGARRCAPFDADEARDRRTPYVAPPRDPAVPLRRPSPAKAGPRSVSISFPRGSARGIRETVGGSRDARVLRSRRAYLQRAPIPICGREGSREIADRPPSFARSLREDIDIFQIRTVGSTERSIALNANRGNPRRS